MVHEGQGGMKRDWRSWTESKLAIHALLSRPVFVFNICRNLSHRRDNSNTHFTR